MVFIYSTPLDQLRGNLAVGAQADLGPDPFSLGMWLIRRMVATSSAAKLRAEVGALDLIEVAKFPPRLIANRTGDVNFQL